MYIGIDIGGTNLKYGIVDSDGNIYHQSSIHTVHGKDPHRIITDIIECIYSLSQYSDEVLTVGIGVPGVVDVDGVIRVSPNLPSLNNVNLKKEIEKQVDFPIAIDNDANAAAVAELEIGAGKDIQHFIYVTLGTGVGGTIISNRQIFRGSIGGAGEIGHTIIQSFNKKINNIPDFRKGTLEELTGRMQILDRMKTILKDSDSKLNDIENYDVKDISNLADAGDSAAAKCLCETGEYLGIGMASAMNLLDIPTIVIGGGISEASDILFDSILKTILRRALPTISERAEIRKAFFRKDAGIIGAAMLGLNKLKAMDYE
ncbi:ROK family protein [Bacteroidota bacterium]